MDGGRLSSLRSISHRSCAGSALATRKYLMDICYQNTVPEMIYVCRQMMERPAADLRCRRCFYPRVIANIRPRRVADWLWIFTWGPA